MNRDRLHFLFLNIGHFLDHLFMLIFATAAALALSREWGLSYGELLGYATPGFFAFGLCAYPAGWIADKWSRHGMMCVFFIGIGIASVATGFSGGDETKGADWKVAPEEVAEVVVNLLSHPARSLPSRVELRPTQPPRK